MQIPAPFMHVWKGNVNESGPLALSNGYPCEVHINQNRVVIYYKQKRITAWSEPSVLSVDESELILREPRSRKVDGGTICPCNKEGKIVLKLSNGKLLYKWSNSNQICISEMVSVTDVSNWVEDLNAQIKQISGCVPIALPEMHSAPPVGYTNVSALSSGCTTDAEHMTRTVHLASLQNGRNNGLTSALREQYFCALNPSPTWPIQPHRIQAIYRTMQRPISDATNHGKAALIAEILSVSNDFDSKAYSLTESQDVFDKWHIAAMRRLQLVQFNWRDQRGHAHSAITMGLAQKFLNLALKDWWCVEQPRVGFDFSVLHAPFDNVVWNRLWPLTRFNISSLNSSGTSKGFYLWSNQIEYDDYQAHLVSVELSSVVNLRMQQTLQSAGLSEPPQTRIEMEQLLWSG